MKAEIQNRQNQPVRHILTQVWKRILQVLGLNPNQSWALRDDCRSWYSTPTATSCPQCRTLFWSDHPTFQTTQRKQLQAKKPHNLRTNSACGFIRGFDGKVLRTFIFSTDNTPYAEVDLAFNTLVRRPFFFFYFFCFASFSLAGLSPRPPCWTWASCPFWWRDCAEY